MHRGGFGAEAWCTSIVLGSPVTPPPFLGNRAVCLFNRPLHVSSQSISRETIFPRSLLVYHRFGTGNRVQTSPDGITWTIRTSAADQSWRGGAFGNGTFVLVASDGHVQTSSDGGIMWVNRTSASGNQWRSVTFGNDTFVAVAQSGIGNRVQTSSDGGITWLNRTSADDNGWQSVTMYRRRYLCGTGFHWISQPGPNFLPRRHHMDE